MLPARRAAAAIDISGDWNMTLLHPDAPEPLTCSATITQTAGSLSVPMSCTLLGSGTLTGMIDVDAGTFNLSGTLGVQPVSFGGQSAADGNSASGFWVATGIPSNGKFSGFRGTAGVGGVTELSDVTALASTTQAPAGRGVPVGLLVLVTAIAGVAAIGVLAAVRRRLA